MVTKVGEKVEEFGRLFSLRDVHDISEQIFLRANLHSTLHDKMFRAEGLAPFHFGFFSFDT